MKKNIVLSYDVECETIVSYIYSEDFEKSEVKQELKDRNEKFLFFLTLAQAEMLTSGKPCTVDMLSKVQLEKLVNYGISFSDFSNTVRESVNL